MVFGFIAWIRLVSKVLSMSIRSRIWSPLSDVFQAAFISVGRQILKIQVLPRYLPGFSLAGTYLTSRQNPGTYLTCLTQVPRYSDTLITCCGYCSAKVSRFYSCKALILRYL